jgi:uncharacterized membrane protein YcjF (UPF0283 family)
LLNPKGPWNFEKEPSPSPSGRDERSEEVLGQMRREGISHAERARISKGRDTMLLMGEVALAVIAVVATAIYWIVESARTESSLSLAQDLLPLLLIGAIVVVGVDRLRRTLAFDKRYAAHARAATGIKRESSLFKSGARPYADAEDSTALLTERFEGILMEFDDAMLVQGRSSGILVRSGSDPNDSERSGRPG